MKYHDQIQPKINHTFLHVSCTCECSVPAYMYLTKDRQEEDKISFPFFSESFRVESDLYFISGAMFNVSSLPKDG